MVAGAASPSLLVVSGTRAMAVAVVDEAVAVVDEPSRDIRLDEMVLAVTGRPVTTVIGRGAIGLPTGLTAGLAIGLAVTTWTGVATGAGTIPPTGRSTVTT